jgi:hypothetical protein
MYNRIIEISIFFTGLMVNYPSYSPPFSPISMEYVDLENEQCNEDVAREMLE